MRRTSVVTSGLSVACDEMPTGRRAFEGEDLSDTLASVLKSAPDWNALPVDVPAARPC